MILNTGQRTDIPAFYSEWFCNRLREKHVLVRNPYNVSQLIRYRISPDVVDAICFCTKNPAPILAHMKLLAPFGQLWFVTITPYGKSIEPNVPDKTEIIESFKALSKIVGAARIVWRYDPIIIFGKYTVAQHMQSFEKMCRALSGFTKTCVISFIDLYPKVCRNFPDVQEVAANDRRALGKSCAEIGASYGIQIKACAEGNDLAQFGIDCTGCMTKAVYEAVLGCSLNIPEKNYARKECNCYLSADIGAYNTCAHFCRYCYANYDRQTVLNNMQRHNPRSPLLIGNVQHGDIIQDAVQTSFKNGQAMLHL